MFQNISDYTKNLICGLVLIFVMIMNVTSERRKERRHKEENKQVRYKKAAG